MVVEGSTVWALGFKKSLVTPRLRENQMENEIDREIKTDVI